MGPAALLLAFSLVAQSALAIEEPSYQVIESDDVLQIRVYDDTVVATTHIKSDFKDAGNQAFRRLGGYIFGDNAQDQKIAMTAPVTQSGNPDDGYWVSFFMPAEHALEALPTPSNGTVEIRALEGQTFAAVRYRGGWREKLYQKHLDRLMTALAESGNWKPAGEPIWARYNPPITPSFLRTNEILIPVERLGS